MTKVTLLMAATDQGDGTASVKFFADEQAAELANHVESYHYGGPEFDLEKITFEFNDAGELVGTSGALKTVADALENMNPDDEQDQEIVARLGLSFD